MGARVHLFTHMLLGLEDVLANVLLVIALVAAVWTTIWLEPGVNTAVPMQLAVPRGSVVTVWTFEGAFPVVPPLVFHKVVRTFCHVPTGFA
uniref:Putative secreted protein n=1 Tax=Ixodes ricinus TaxID=34613 RepID=A0A6B0U7C5_IXORI